MTHNVLTLYCVTVLNKHVNHVKAANSQTVWEQNVPGFLTAFPTVPESVGCLSLSSIEDTSEPKMDTVDINAFAA